jgi:plasmid stability protein
MPDILIRDVNARAIKRLKARAKRHGRSFQGEAKLVLEQSAGTQAMDGVKLLEKWKKRFAGRTFDNCAELIREDRDR